MAASTTGHATYLTWATWMRDRYADDVAQMERVVEWQRIRFESSLADLTAAISRLLAEEGA